MKNIYRKDDHGTSSLGWLESLFHFSFAEYYNPNRIHFGALRVINDDLIKPNTGFGLHPHKDMEIVSYVVEGKLTHADNMGNKREVSRGNIQYMSAGTGVMHSEHNYATEVTRLLQIWIFPDKKNLQPNYGDYDYPWEDRKNKLLHMVSGQDGDAEVKVHQDINIYSLFLEEGKELDFDLGEDRQLYAVQIEGNSVINNLDFQERDGMEVIEENLHITAKSDSHLLFLEMKKRGK